MSRPFDRLPAARALAALRNAVSLLTIIPVPPAGDPAEGLAEARYAFPVVGAAIGAVLACLSWSASQMDASAGLGAFLVLAAGAILTGGLHLDGLADTADGLFLSGGAERRLAAMRDPHIGSFGVAAMVLTLLGKFSAYSQLSDRDRAWAVLAAVLLSRTLLLVASGMAPYARPEGTGRLIVGAGTPRESGIAALVALICVTLLFGASGLLAGLAAIGLAFGLTAYADSRLGGITGDVLGALVELGELAFLVVLALLRPSGYSAH